MKQTLKGKPPYRAVFRFMEDLQPHVTQPGGVTTMLEGVTWSKLALFIYPFSSLER